jgi:hypothetical protein
MKKLVMLLALAVAFSLSGFAQTSSTDTSGGQSSTDTGKTAKKGKKAASSDMAGSSDTAGKKAGKSSTITGCLKSDSNPVTIANGKFKKGVEVDTSGASGEDWSKHNGHKVQLTGSWEGTGADKKFKATSMKHIDATCTVAGGAKASAATSTEGGSKKKGKKGASDTSKTPS